MKIPYVMKRCSKCGRWLVASTVNFHKQKTGKYGLRSKCKECIKQYRENNRDELLEYHKQWYKDNKDKIVETNKQYREANREKIVEYYKANRDKRIEYHKQWYKDNKDKQAEYYKQYKQTPQGQIVAFNSRQKRRTKEEQLGSGITKDQWLELMSFFDWKCAYSGETLTKDTRSIDHIVPLNSNGDNMIWNCVPMLRSLNSSKHDKDMEKWYRKQSFYSEARLAKIYEWQEYARKKWKNS